MNTNIQSTIERQRSHYAKLGKPLLQYMAEIHGLTVRQFAAVFGIGKSHAAEILHHRVLPSLELAVRIARYFDTNADELFGWRVDDDGARRPVVVELPWGTITLNTHSDGKGIAFSGMKLVDQVIAKLEERGE